MKTRKVLLIFLGIILIFLAGIFYYTYQIIGFSKISFVNDIGKISFIIAFLAGILSIFSPCTIAVIPSFIAYTLKEKKDIVKMTAVFFAGFSTSFIIIGLLIAYLGKISFTYFQNDSSQLIQIIGFLLIVFGILTVIGKGFTFLNLGIKPKHDVPGIFIFGMLFSVGWSACTGPVISGIIALAASFNDYTSSAILLFFYALGIAVPLFIMAFAYETYNLAQSSLIKGKEFSFTILGQDITIHTTKAISGALLIGLGLLFLIYKGTTVLTTADIFGKFAIFIIFLFIGYQIYKAISSNLKSQNYKHITLGAIMLLTIVAFAYISSKTTLSTVQFADDFNRLMLQHSATFNIIGTIILISFCATLYYFVKQRKEI